MPLELIKGAGGDPRNARTLAHAADLAYFAEAEGKPKFKADLNLEAQLFSVGNTQAWVATNDEHIVVAFRGTEAPTSIEGLKDWLLTDAMNLLIVPEGRLGTDLMAAGAGARFHQGFVNALADIWDPVLQAVEAELQKAERPLWITGHSLGGSLALLSAWMFTRKFISVHQVYTFGAPMIGNREAAAAFDRELAGKIFRYVDLIDPIPQLPSFSLVANRYLHCEKEMGLGQAGDAFAGGQAAGDLSGGVLDSFWSWINQRLAAHAMENYRSRITKLFG